MVKLITIRGIVYLQKESKGYNILMHESYGNISKRLRKHMKVNVISHAKGNEKLLNKRSRRK